MKKRGKFIVIDGADGCGKATQTKLLTERLISSGYQAETIDFPRYKDNFFGKIIRDCIDGKYGEFAKVDPHLASILYAGDRFESSALVKKWLDEGKHVIADRYVSANQLHQGGKIKDVIERKKYFQWLDQLEYGMLEIPVPDLTFYLRVPYSLSVELMTKGADDRAEADAVERDVEYQLNTRESGISMLQDPSWVQINCSEDEKNMLPREVINDLIFKHCLTILS